MAFQDGEVGNMSWRQRSQRLLVGEMMVGGPDAQEERKAGQTATASSGEERLEARPFAQRDQDNMEA